MQVYRIAKRRHAQDISGTGSALFPGRWNVKGTPVLYTGENPEIALLEAIVHVPPLLIPTFDLLTLEIPDSILRWTAGDLPSNWSQYPAPTILSEMGQQWIREGETLALQVPSCIVQTAHNFILNCRHPQYSEVKILDQKKFDLDPRLIK